MEQGMARGAIRVPETHIVGVVLEDTWYYRIQERGDTGYDSKTPPTGSKQQRL